MDKSLVLSPIMSEKAYGLSQVRNTYTFSVPQGANKHSVARAVSSQYEVEVASVNITNILGKAKRTVRKNGRVSKGRQNDIRKAYVTLKDGQSIPIFAAIEEEAKQAEQTNEKLEKAAAKAAVKAEKAADKAEAKEKK
jgi:large subunit ribosomal protein L23